MIRIKSAVDGKIVAEGLVVKYGPVTALNSFSASIPKGVVGLLGPNGAGKSTFIKTALGLLVPESGAISIKGMSPTTNSDAVRDIVGYMPENECLINRMNAVELVAYMGGISGLPSKDAMQRAHAVLDFVGIGEERYRPIESYSTGMKQRVKLAQAIVHDPEILFLDEPTNGMDPQGREVMLDLIKKLGRSGKSVLVSSHILQEVERVSEYVVIISDGHLVTEGPIKALMHGRENVYKLRLKGSRGRINRFLSKLKKEAEVISKRDDEGGSVSILLKVEDTALIFALASEERVQIRSFGPEILSLEDVFLREMGREVL